jgi:hypothetical protein
MPIGIIALLWVACVIATAILAYAKGRSVVAWSLLALCCWPAAMIILAVRPVDNHTLIKRMGGKCPNLAVCQKCGYMYPASFRKCPFCNPRRRSRC